MVEAAFIALEIQQLPKRYVYPFHTCTRGDPLHIDSFLKRLGGWGSPDINQIEIEIETRISILISNFDLL